MLGLFDQDLHGHEAVTNNSSPWSLSERLYNITILSTIIVCVLLRSW